MEAKLRNLQKKIIQKAEKTGTELNYIHSMLWLQATTTLRTDYTVKSSKIVESNFDTILQNIDRDYDTMFIQKRKITKEELDLALMPLARFSSAFPTQKEIEGSDILFNKHPDLEDGYAINAKGIKTIAQRVRAYLCRRHELMNFHFYESENTCYSPATPDKIKRALEIALARADSCATDENMNGARNRVIARYMPKRTLYDFDSSPYVLSKDFYLAMRETNPSGLNQAHRDGSVPPLLALKDDGTVLQEIYLILILLHPTPCEFIDDTAAGLARDTPSHHPALGYFCGEYVLVRKNGECVLGAKSGIAGAVSILSLLLKKYDPQAHQYIEGTISTFRSQLLEEEFMSSSCF